MSSIGNNDDDVNRMHISDSSGDDSVESAEILEVPGSQAQKGSNVSKEKSKRKKPPVAPSPSTSTTAGKKKKKKKSPVWDHYESDEDEEFATCLYCKAKITCSRKNGTTAMKNHTERCKKLPANIDKKQKVLSFEKKTVVSDDGTTKIVDVPKLWVFNQDRTRKACAKMIILDELPFSFVEREGFRLFCEEACPQFSIPSRSTATRDCYQIFIEERKKMKNFFQNLSSRVCLTTDTWTSGQNLSYMCLTAHFIDDDWKLHKRIINFCPIAGHSGALIGRAVEKCLIEWGVGI